MLVCKSDYFQAAAGGKVDCFSRVEIIKPATYSHLNVWLQSQFIFILYVRSHALSLILIKAATAVLALPSLSGVAPVLPLLLPL